MKIQQLRKTKTSKMCLDEHVLIPSPQALHLTEKRTALKPPKGAHGFRVHPMSYTENTRIVYWDPTVETNNSLLTVKCKSRRKNKLNFIKIKSFVLQRNPSRR
jgi:hypothetical protein